MNQTQTSSVTSSQPVDWLQLQSGPLGGDNAHRLQSSLTVTMTTQRDMPWRPPFHVPPEQNWQALWLLPAAMAGVTGNILVCIAVGVDRKLQHVTNYFLVSLAVADLLVSLVVMPFCTIQELMGYWPLGFEVCGFWQVCDVTLCTSSIMHLCTISIDRFLSIRNPMVARNRSAGVVGVKIGVVWMISILIASPLVFVAVFRPGELMEPRVKHCAIMNAHFLVYGSLTAFFVPLVIMLVTYSLSMRLLTKQALVLSNGQCPLRRMKRGATSPDARIDTQGELFPDDSGLVMGAIARDISREERDEELTQALDCSASPHTESCCGINGGFVSKERLRTNAETMLDFDGLPAATSTSSRCGFPMRASRYLPINTSDTSLVVPQNGKPSSFLRLPATIGRKDVEEVGGVFDCENVFSERQHSSHSRMFHGAHDPKRTTPSETAIEALTLHDEPHSAISGGTANEEGMLCFRRFRNRLFERTSEARTRRLQKLPQQPESYLTDDSIMKTPGDKPRSTSSEEPRPGTEPPSINASNRRFRSLVQKHSATLRVAGILIAKRERQTRAALHSVRNERKAIRVLGVMFAIFFVCWAPFFCVNLTMGVCDGCHHTGSLLFRAFLWLGYVSSTLNPIVYTVFNRSFRQTFLDILLPRRHCCRR